MPARLETGSQEVRKVVNEDNRTAREETCQLGQRQLVKKVGQLSQRTGEPIVWISASQVRGIEDNSKEISTTITEDP